MYQEDNSNSNENHASSTTGGVYQEEPACGGGSGGDVAAYFPIAQPVPVVMDEEDIVVRPIITTKQETAWL